MWFLVGFASGWVASWLWAAWSLWPVEDRALFKWIRWATKSTVKWAFIALIFAVVVFIIVQILNYVYFAREVQKHSDDAP